MVHGMHSLESVKQVLLEEKTTRSLTSIFGAHEDAQSSVAQRSEATEQNGVPVVVAS